MHHDRYPRIVHNTYVYMHMNMQVSCEMHEVWCRVKCMHLSCAFDAANASVICLAITTTHTYQMRLSCALLSQQHTHIPQQHTHIKCVCHVTTHISNASVQCLAMTTRSICHVPCYDHKVRGVWKAQGKGKCLKTTRLEHASEGKCLKTTRLKACPCAKQSIIRV